MRVYTEEDYKGYFNLNQMEKQYIKIAMRKTEGHRANAAKLLCITERTLYNKLINHGL